MRPLITAALLVSLASPAVAQERTTFDVAGGHQFLRDQELEENFLGFHVSGAGYIMPMFGVVGEFSGQYRNVDVVFTELVLSLYSFMAGPRISAPRPARVAPFAQLLIGGVRGSASIFGQTESRTEFAIQPAGGIDVWFTRHVGVRGTGYYRRIFLEPEGVNQFGFQVGIVVGNGGR
jgi:hypothetical protein